MSRVKIVTTVPVAHSATIRQVLGAGGAGSIGEYSFCSFSITGTGRFIPSEQADPFVGTSNVFEEAEEERIEVTCDRDIAATVVRLLRDVHPYEEPAIDIYGLIDETDL